MSNQLIFNNITLSPISQADNQIWLSSAELAKALGYSQENAVAKIFNRKADEFSDNMTKVVEVSKSKNLLSKTRIFSLRGCHLIAMFARTDIAKKFRIWVLDILDKEVGQPVAQPLDPISTVDDRKPLVKAVDMLVDETGAIYSNVWRMVWQRFDVTSVEQLTVGQVKEAIEYIHNLFLQTIQVKQPIQNVSHEQIQTARLANTQSYRYLSILQHEVNAMNQHLQQMLNLNIEIDRKLVAFG